MIARRGTKFERNTRFAGGQGADPSGAGAADRRPAAGHRQVRERRLYAAAGAGLSAGPRAGLHGAGAGAGGHRRITGEERRRRHDVTGH